MQVDLLLRARSANPEVTVRGNLSRPWRVGDQRPWQIDQIVSILTQALRGLASLHASPDPVIHRDIKPDNILVADQHSGGEVFEAGPWIKLADFGLATQGSKCEGFAGTWLYTAPEAFFDVRYTSKIDIWSLGVVILQLLLKGNIPDASGDYVEGEHWCRDIFNHAKRNSDFSVKKDRKELRENEYSLRSFLWVFIRNFMLQGDANKRLSARECLKHPLFQQMYSASRLGPGWRIGDPIVDANGNIIDHNFTKQFSPRAKAPLPTLNIEAVNKATYEPGVKVADALRAQQSKATQTKKSSKPARPRTPQPIGFGLVIEGYDYRANRTIG